VAHHTAPCSVVAWLPQWSCPLSWPRVSTKPGQLHGLGGAEDYVGHRRPAHFGGDRAQILFPAAVEDPWSDREVSKVGVVQPTDGRQEMAQSLVRNPGNNLPERLVIAKPT
jgi:hypothetical protein